MRKSTCRPFGVRGPARAFDSCRYPDLIAAALLAKIVDSDSIGTREPPTRTKMHPNVTEKCPRVTFFATKFTFVVASATVSLSEVTEGPTKVVRGPTEVNRGPTRVVREPTKGHFRWGGVRPGIDRDIEALRLSDPAGSAGHVEGAAEGVARLFAAVLPAVGGFFCRFHASPDEAGPEGARRGEFARIAGGGGESEGDRREIHRAWTCMDRATCPLFSRGEGGGFLLLPLFARACGAAKFPLICMRGSP